MSGLDRGGEGQLVRILERICRARFSEICDAPHRQPRFNDDCARVLETSLVSGDTLVEGVHFDPRLDSWEEIGAQAAQVNLSDLAASAGAPRWAHWQLSLPPETSVEAIEALTRGFADALAREAVPVVGGNLCQRAGPLEISVTLAGIPFAGGPIGRDGARPGDAVYVSGALGARSLYFVAPSESNRALRHRWSPQLSKAKALAEWGYVSAMLDLSDGLIRDAARLAEESNVSLQLQSNTIPIHQALHAQLPPQEALELGLYGGEDYLLLFTTAPAERPPVEAWRIGCCSEGSGLSIDDAPPRQLGFDHFAPSLPQRLNLSSQSKGSSHRASDQ
ncbi:MAG: thiamine-phosphate kinase [Myxococcota bacterium]|nr:thiamine-phosphate kinase [Myxococcota bacterium]